MDQLVSSLGKEELKKKKVDSCVLKLLNLKACFFIPVLVKVEIKVAYIPHSEHPVN